MTTYYFIRHCEKEIDGTMNPHLTDKGQKRAQFWAEFLADKNIDSIFCTPLVRTQETAAPLAFRLGIEIQLYDPSNLYSLHFQQITRGKIILVVGHQDTTPTFINRILKERRYGYIQNHEFGNLYRVTVTGNGAAKAEFQRLEYPPAENH